MKPPALPVIFAALALLAGCSTHAIQGDGQVTEERRPVSSFSILEAAGAFEIQWGSGPPGLAVTADRNLLPHIKTTVARDRLLVSVDAELHPTHGISIALSGAALKDMSLRGAVHLVATQISGEALNIGTAGAVRVQASGAAGHLHAGLTGASELEAFDLQTETAEITLTGAGHANVAASRHLKATITGAGTVVYAGHPEIEQKITGAGSIHQRH
jgi:hypothetical protein